MAETPLTVLVKSASDLTPEDVAAWTALRVQNPALYSPYFHPDYTRLVGDLRGDVSVTIASLNDTPVAFFPFQGAKPSGGGFARPVGAPMTDYHGIVQAAGSDLDATAMLRDAGLGALHFSAIVDPDDQFADSIQTRTDCTMMDLSGGAEAWRAERDSSYRRHLKSHRRRVRKAEDEIGPRRFEYKSQDRAIFDQLISWKRQKFAETGKYDVLSAGWTLALIERLWERGPDAALRADMHVMYFGDRIAAIDLGLSDGPIFHSWIVAYDGDLHSYAPGIQLLEDMVDQAGAQGYSRIDLGEGLDGYKRHYASDPISVGSGFVAVKGPAAALSQLYGATERLGQKTLKDAPGKLRRRYSQISACDDSFSGRAKAMFNAVKASGKG